MKNDDKAIMVLAGAQYHTDAVVAASKTGPVITVKRSELNVSSGPNVNPDHVIKYIGHTPSVAASGVVFFKQHGKYTVLFGISKIPADGDTITGKLLSTPMLKKAKVELPAAPTRISNPVLPANLGSSFNRPQREQRNVDPDEQRRIDRNREREQQRAY